MPRYDATKLATTRAFSPICIGKSPKKLSFCFWKMAQNRKNSTPDQFLRPKFDWDQQNMLLYNSIRQIFYFLIFRRDMASFARKNRWKSQNRLFFRGNEAISRQKIKKSKIWRIELWRSIFCRSQPNFGPRNWSGVEFLRFWAIFQKQKLSFFGDFPIQIGENVRVVANFVASYLGTRAKLRDKWAHFGKEITRTTRLY